MRSERPTCSGQVFWKRLKVDKTLAKVTSQRSTNQRTGGYSKKAKVKSLDYGKKDLRWTKAFPLGRGSRSYRNPKPCKDQGKSPRQPTTLPRESEKTQHACTFEYTLNYSAWSGRPTPSRSHTQLHGKLAKTSKQPVGARRGKGGSGPMACSAGTTESQCVEQEGPGTSSDKSREDATAICQVSPVKGQFLSRLFLVQKKRWDVQTSGKSESSEQVHGKELLQDGNFSHPEGCTTEREIVCHQLTSSMPTFQCL